MNKTNLHPLPPPPLRVHGMVLDWTLPFSNIWLIRLLCKKLKSDDNTPPPKKKLIVDDYMKRLIPHAPTPHKIQRSLFYINAPDTTWRRCAVTDTCHCSCNNLRIGNCTNSLCYRISLKFVDTQQLWLKPHNSNRHFILGDILCFSTLISINTYGSERWDR